ncbi:MAG TPA: tRNA pseudouridine(55) synthase TruB [Nitrospirae bacterium]|nr:tRNA pseudouridine(55) synthase TruB [Nitrospirota bacterium]
MFKDNAVINLYKPVGITSHKAVKKVQDILKARKAGHTGTLDPFAEGVLLVCLNRATRIAEYIEGLPKVYTVVMRLGISTDTYDMTGEVISRGEAGDIGVETVEKAMSAFQGKIMQVPPMYSALKVGGVPLYKLARKGIEVARKEREVTIESIKLTEYNPPDVRMTVKCSKGTYIRSLVHDIGTALGPGAAVKELRRDAVGNFRYEDSETFDGIESGRFSVITMDRAIGHLREISLDEERARLVRHGVGFYHDGNRIQDGVLRLKDPSGELLGIGRPRQNGFIRIEKVFVD